jgi:hypothetical protein
MPIQAMKHRYGSHPELFVKRPHDLPGSDSGYESASCARSDLLKSPRSKLHHGFKTNIKNSKSIFSIQQDKNPMKKEILLYYTTDPGKRKPLISKFRDAFIASGPGREFACIGYLADSNQRTDQFKLNGHSIPYHIYGRRAVEDLNYPIKVRKEGFELKPGNADIPIILFSLAFPEYEVLWVMEDDVDFSGDPLSLFQTLTGLDSDLLATHVDDFFEGWDHGARFRSGSHRPHKKNLCFLPFFRINSRAIQHIHQAYENGWDGHHEMVWPTVLRHHGMSIFDIGGCGPYVTPEFRNRFYDGLEGDGFKKNGTFGTMTIRLTPGLTPGKLWHPIKDFKSYVIQMRKRYLSIFRWWMQRARGRRC